jgi:aromatic ring-opening dioxygenase catalytic subunit (LigB family)
MQCMLITATKPLLALPYAAAIAQCTHTNYRWLKQTMSAGVSPEERRQRLENWERTAPHARFAHPREEHLLPLHVAIGAAGDAAAEPELILDATLLGGMSMASYAFRQK